MSAPVPFFDYRPLYHRLKSEIDDALRRVLDSGQLILGPEVRAFEGEFARWQGREHAVGVSSGTDALSLALRALEVGAGDEVLTVANAGAPPVAAIRAAGATPRFVDVDPSTLQLDPGGLERACTPRSRAILVVHLYGQAAPLEPILRFAGRHGLRVVEDCAQALGTRYQGRLVGSHGDIACFSFYPTKNLGAFGDGGLCLTGDPALERRLRRLRMYGFGDGDRSSAIEGVNSRLDELQAAVLRVKLRHVEALIDERLELARRYTEALSGGPLRPLAVPPGTRPTHHLFVVRGDDRDAVRAALERASIATVVHYPVPVHRMPAYHGLAAVGALPHSEHACASVLSLPLYNAMPPDHVDRVVRAVMDRA